MIYVYRYTEGDFHYLKKARINKNPVPRQYSLAAHTDARSCSNQPPQLYSTTETYCGNMPGNNGSYTAAHAQGYVNEPVICKTSDDIPPQIVNVEVHKRFDCGINDSQLQSMKLSYSYSRSPTLDAKLKTLQPTSHSMDTVSPTDTSAYKQKRRVKSYDDVLYYDYDVLKITEFSRGPYFNSEFDPIMEVEALGTGKVRYNDMGSLEVLNEDKLDSFDEFEFENNIIPDESDADTETTINGTQQFREIWNLRATFEEEEECSDTIRMEDMASPDESSSDRGCEGISYSPTYHINHKDSTAHFNPIPINKPNRDTFHVISETCAESTLEKVSANLLHPDYENRRDDFRKVVRSRYQKRGSTSAENSFDSFETADTDGDATESSRHEVTTSFESTTDNTDSTNESQTSRLRQMKADSGYKSMENQLPPNGANGAKKSFDVEDEIIVLGSEVTQPPPNEVLEAIGTNESIPRRGSLFEKRRGRTASKRRREYSRERQVIRLSETMYEPETDSTRSDQPSGDSFDEPTTPSTKLSLFSRFFKSHRTSREKSLSRDFSIDEKTNSIFQEFVRYDPKFDFHRGSNAGLESRRSRLQRKYTDPGPGTFYEDRKWLSPEMRSTSLGSDSSASSARRISPRDSIEEEEVEEDIDAAVMDHKNRILENQEQQTTAEVTTPTVSVHEIPIIKLPEEESVNV